MTMITNQTSLPISEKRCRDEIFDSPHRLTWSVYSKIVLNLLQGGAILHCSVYVLYKLRKTCESATSVGQLMNATILPYKSETSNPMNVSLTAAPHAKMC